MTICMKCGEYVPKEVRLVGGYHTRLCAKHKNEWHEYIFMSPAYKDFRDLSVDLEVAIAAGDVDAALRVNGRRINLEWRLYEIAKEWCEVGASVSKQSVMDMLEQRGRRIQELEEALDKALLMWSKYFWRLSAQWPEHAEHGEEWRKIKAVREVADDDKNSP